MALKTKKATPKHCPDILRIGREGGLFNYTHLFYAMLIALGWVYVILDSDTVIGYVCYLAFPIIRKTFTLQIGITESYRGQGIGANSLDFLCHEVKRKHKTNTILAHTLKPRVVRLFQRQSWKVIASVLGIFLVKKKIR